MTICLSFDVQDLTKVEELIEYFEKQIEVELLYVKIIREVLWQVDYWQLVGVNYTQNVSSTWDHRYALHVYSVFLRQVRGILRLLGERALAAAVQSWLVHHQVSHL